MMLKDHDRDDRLKCVGGEDHPIPVWVVFYACAIPISTKHL